MDQFCNFKVEVVLKEGIGESIKQMVTNFMNDIYKKYGLEKESDTIYYRCKQNRNDLADINCFIIELERTSYYNDLEKIYFYNNEENSVSEMIELSKKYKEKIRGIH